MHVSKAAFLGDAVAVAAERQMAPQFAKGRLRYIDAAHLVMFGLGCGGDEVSSGAARSWRFKIKSYLEDVADSDGIGAGTLGHNDFAVSALPSDHGSSHAMPVADHGEPPAACVPHAGGVPYAEFSRGELVAVLGVRDATIEDFKARLHDAQKLKSYHMNRNQELVAMLRATEEEREALVHELNLRPNLRNVSVYGGHALALSRNVGHAGGQATLGMIAGSEEKGDLHDKHIVYRYEHHTAHALQMRAASEYDALGACEMEVHCFKSDATHQEAIDHNKIHCATVASIGVPSLALFDGDDQGDLMALAEQLVHVRAVCDLQNVVHGNGAETYALSLLELKSVSCPSWEARADEAIAAARAPGADARRIATYCFGADAGPDNLGMGKRIRQRLLGNDSVSFVMVFCFMHQIHLAVLAMLTIVEEWEWPDTGADGMAAPPGRYFGSVATVANVWRTPGSHRKIKDAAARLFDGHVSEAYFGRLPGRPLRGRWGRISDVEKLLAAARKYIGQVFAKVWQKDVAAAKSAQPAEAGGGPRVGADEDAQYKAEQRTYRLTSVSCTNSRLWNAQVLISLVAKGPLSEFLNWAQKAVGKNNQLLKAADKLGTTYVGPTPLSELVGSKSNDIYQKICALLTSTAMDEDTVWGPLWESLQHREVRASACALIVRLVLAEAASWEHRVRTKVTSFPLLLLRMVEQPPHEFDPVRQLVATELMTTDDCCLQAPYSDLAIKYKRLFGREFQKAREDGDCPRRLYNALVLLRSKLPLDNQDLEGMNSILQQMAKLAPRLKLPMATARMVIKKSPDITAQECASMHTAATASQALPEQAFRFLPITSDQLLPEPPRFKPCKHQAPTHAARACGLSLAAYAELDIDVRHMYHVSGRKDVYFVLCWSYSCHLWVALGSVDTFFGPKCFTLNQPLETLPLRDFLLRRGGLQAPPQGDGLSSKRRRVGEDLELTRETLVWNAVSQANVTPHSRATVTLTPRPPRKQEGGVTGADDDQVDPWAQELESELGRIMEEVEAREAEAAKLEEGFEDQLEAAEDAVLDESGHADEPDEPERPRPAAGAAVRPLEPEDPLIEGIKERVRVNKERLRLAWGQIATQSPAIHPMRHGVISLIKRGDLVMFVRWTTRPGKCRQIQLDRYNRICTVGPVPEIDLNDGNYEVIIRDTMTIMLQTSAAGRPPMTPWALTLQTHANTRMFQGPFASNELECVSCQGDILGGMGGDPEWRVQLQLYMCTCCLSPWHNACIDMVADD
ncbi:unnamed protein product, partial [Prorocentrum cordatum]